MSANKKDISGLESMAMIYAKTEMPSILYQYTDIDAFCGIIENNEIWATHWRYLNDKNELKYGFDQMLFWIQKLKKKKYLPDTQEFLSQVEKKLCNVPDFLPLEDKDLYIVSLSKQKDLLSQWRGYGKKYKSVCIGFSTKKMKMSNPLLKWDEDYVLWEDEKYTYKLRKVLYEKNEHIGHTYSLVKFACDDIENELKKGKLQKEIEVRVDDFLDMVTPGLLCIKEPCWKEEKEWRIIVQSSKKDVLDNVKFRKNEYGLVPYIPINLSKTTMMDAIHTVFLPKSENFLLSKKSMEMYWKSMMSGEKQKCKHGLKINQSKISIVY